MTKYSISLVICVLLVAPCSNFYLKQERLVPISVRIPDFVEQVIFTNEEEFIIVVQQGDCLSRIVEKCFEHYFEDNGHKGIFYFKEMIYNIVNSIEIESGNHELIYTGEVISFRLPETLKVYKFDYYHWRKQIYGPDSLTKLLDFQWIVEYTPSIWNCSESAAFVEYYLEDNGFNTDIVCDDSHAWCVVEVQPNLWVDVECVSSSPVIMKTMRHYQTCYKNIWQALDDNGWGEWDWWHRIGDGERIAQRR